MKNSNKRNRLVVIANEISRSELFRLLLLCCIHCILIVIHMTLYYCFQLLSVRVIDADVHFFIWFHYRFVFVVHIEHAHGWSAHIKMFLCGQLQHHSHSSLRLPRGYEHRA